MRGKMGGLFLGGAVKGIGLGSNFFRKILLLKSPPLMVFALSTATISGILRGVERIVPPYVSGNQSP
jgi:hypothetical protein